jgi:hypothetical protein
LRFNGPVFAISLAGNALNSFAALAHQLGGHVGLAIAPLLGGATIALGNAQVAPAWSTSKVPVLVARLHDLEAAGKPLSAQDRAWATAAIEQSDNASIESIFTELERSHGGLAGASLAVQRTLREAGDEHTVINTAPNDEGYTTYGQTRWSNSAEIVFYRALAEGRLLRPGGTNFVLDLMERVIPAQRFGAGAAGYPAATRLAFKGGWGPNPQGAYTVRQTAIVGTGSRGYVVSLLALPASGSFEDGTEMLNRLATWVREHASVS